MKIQSKILIKRFLSIVFVGLSIFSYVGCSFRFEKDYLYYRDVIENAQYVPDPSSLVIDSDESNRVVSLTEDGYEKIISLVERMYVLSGVGKHEGYIFSEKKDELIDIIDRRPEFGVWTKIPYPRNTSSKNLPFNYLWSYKVDYNDKLDVLSIDSISLHTRTSYLDFETRSSIENYEDGTSIIQVQAMRTLFYKDDQNKGVVECYSYTLGIDHYGDQFNYKASNYKPYEYFYLKNVEDTLFSSYHIVVADRHASNSSFDEGGMDIRNLYPYGSSRDYVNIKYSKGESTELLKVSQIFPSSLLITPATTSILLIQDKVDSQSIYSSSFYKTDNLDNNLLNPFSLSDETINEEEIVRSFSFYSSLKYGDRNNVYNPIYSDEVTRKESLTLSTNDNFSYYKELTYNLQSLGLNCISDKLSINKKIESFPTVFTLECPNYQRENVINYYLDFLSKSIVDSHPIAKNWTKDFKDCDTSERKFTLV